MSIFGKGVLIAAGMLCFTGCVGNKSGPIRTQVVTFPPGGIVEYNGEVLGREPAVIILPQDENGMLTNRAVVRALPKDPQSLAQTRTFEPEGRLTRVPNRVMLDMTWNAATNEVRDLTQAERPEPVNPPRYKYIPRSKPTQVVGIDREHTRDTEVKNTSPR